MLHDIAASRSVLPKQCAASSLPLLKRRRRSLGSTATATSTRSAAVEQIKATAQVRDAGRVSFTAR